MVRAGAFAASHLLGFITMSRASQEDGFTVMEITIVLLVIGILCAIATPMVASALSEFRLSGDARNVSNALALAKMRAASNFSRTRLYVDLGGAKHRVETWNKTSSSWVVEGGETLLSGGVSFGYDIIGSAPPSTQATISQSPACLDDDGDPISGTACVMFNSRGIPVDTTLAPTGVNAVYLTDGSAVYAVTVAATGMQRLWHAFPSGTPSWMLN